MAVTYVNLSTRSCAAHVTQAILSALTVAYVWMRWGTLTCRGRKRQQIDTSPSRPKNGNMRESAENHGAWKTQLREVGCCMSIKKLRNKERRSLKAVMQGGVARGEKRGETRMKKLCETLPWKQLLNTHACTNTHTYAYGHKAHPVQSY